MDRFARTVVEIVVAKLLAGTAPTATPANPRSPLFSISARAVAMWHDQERLFQLRRKLKDCFSSVVERDGKWLRNYTLKRKNYYRQKLKGLRYSASYYCADADAVLRFILKVNGLQVFFEFQTRIMQIWCCREQFASVKSCPLEKSALDHVCCSPVGYTVQIISKLIRTPPRLSCPQRGSWWRTAPRCSARRVT